MNITLENIEFYTLILVRISACIAVAPFFNLANIPVKVKLGLSVFLTVLLVQVIKYEPLQYYGTVGYICLVLKEAVSGLLIGYMANICTYIISFAGSIIDMDIGFSMINELNPVTKIETTITGNFYGYLVMLMMIVTNMHYYIIIAIVDSFRLIPIGKAVFTSDLYHIITKFMIDYFVIGFRIVLPVFAATLMVNVILGILAKIAPQMNMFVIGMQLKIFVGLCVLLLVVGTIPTISNFIFDEMKTMTNLILRALSST
jgi:flagellar biosynthetic protein FliR